MNNYLNHPPPYSYPSIYLVTNCRYDDYMNKFPTKPKVLAIPIRTPLCLDSLIELLSITKDCLGPNFISSFLTVTGAALILHYESILDFQDECPIVLCYSSAPGSGMLSSIPQLHVDL